MEELVEVIAKALVDQPEAVEVSSEEVNDELIIRLCVAPEDMGKVIGKQGRIARAIRTVVRASAVRGQKKVNVEIME
ncbi:MAG TPA: KH domain-containing protein [Clostridia bacterium]|nr:KH domain-containing protein [Clostridia bacterium]